MSNKSSSLYYSLFVATALAFTCIPARSQVIPDRTLTDNSEVTLNGNSNVITGGSTAGVNLFHSFEQFSVPTGGVAYFNNAPNIQNIITRVTGLSISNIDGLLQANGKANLFLLNPNGIIFGPNATLNIGGSFLGSTANYIRFADGKQFSATHSQSTPLLTISVPIGLGFTTGTPGSIQVKGYGHNALIATSVSSPIYGAGQSLTGLKTQPGRTIALVGGQVNFDGGILTTPSGRIEVGSVNSGLVNLNLTDTGMLLNYNNIQSFKDIYLDNQALLDASGFLSGDIFLRGRNIDITQKALVLVSNFGSLPLGEININAEGKLGVAGVRTVLESNRAEVGAARGIVSQNFSSGKGADIIISANQLSVQDSGGIATQTFGTGRGGNINLAIKSSTQLFSSNLPTASLTIGTIGTSTAGRGHGGDLKLTTNELSIENGSTFVATTFNSGDGGKVTINASNSLKIIGGQEITFNQTYIDNSFWASSLGTLSTYSGRAGDVDVNTNQLILKDGGLLGSATVASGSAGNLTVNATDSVYVSGKAPNILSPTQIISSATITNPFFQQVFNLPNTLIGKSGYLAINTNRLTIRDGAQVSVRNDGQKNAGSLTIQANLIHLDNQAGITATTTTFSGEGGNIFLNAQNLQLRQNSHVTATAGGSGNGGNITINTNTLTALENSNISANAQSGTGGQVTINTQGLFLSPYSEITATSEAGPQFNGVVQINTLDIDPNRAILKPTAQPEPPIVASACQRGSNTATSEFVITGTGGIPLNPDELLYSQTGWYDSSVPAPKSPQNLQSPKGLTATESTQLVEAQGWRQNPDGTITLTAEANTNVIPYSSLSTPSCYQPYKPRISPSSNAAELND